MRLPAGFWHGLKGNRLLGAKTDAFWETDQSPARSEDWACIVFQGLQGPAPWGAGLRVVGAGIRRTGSDPVRTRESHRSWGWARLAD